MPTINLEPYVPAITAALTLLNTIILVWNGRQSRAIRHRVNGMYFQTLAEAEARGRRHQRAVEAQQRRRQGDTVGPPEPPARPSI